ncbi:MAG TPA: DUF6365 family protein [Actinocrinis sp.]|nr:DUF6365 family protein [Actinocrinis sp.]
MRLLFLAPSRVSRGEAMLAADVARHLPRAGFEAGFAAAEESLPHLRELGLPALPVAGETAARCLEALDPLVRGFKPDCLITADAFSLHQREGWHGLGVGTLRERYGLPVASFDRVGWQAAGYTADMYGGEHLHLPKLLDDCDAVLRLSPPLPPGPLAPGTVVAPLRLGGLRDGGLRSLQPASADSVAADSAATGSAASDSATSDSTTSGSTAADRRPTVFLVTSRWETRNPARSLPVAQLIDALPRVLHSHLAALGRPLRVVHVASRPWRFPVAEQIEYRHFGRLPFAMFHERVASADLFLTTNLLSPTLAQAVLNGTPAVLLGNGRELGPHEMPDWLVAAAPLLRGAHPFRVAPLGWHDLLEPMLEGNPYAECFASAQIFDREDTARAITTLLDDAGARDRLAARRQELTDALAALPPPGPALRAAVGR